MTTFKEIAEREYPEKIDKYYDGGVFGCPYHYDYETEEKSLKNCERCGGQGCEYCWSREIPTYEPTNEPTAKESDSLERLKTVEKNYDCLYAFVQSKGLDREFEKWRSPKPSGRFTEMPQANDRYFFTNCTGDTDSWVWYCFDDVVDKYRYQTMPLWKTREDAERYREVQNHVKSKSRPFVYGKVNYFLKYSNNKHSLQYVGFEDVQFPNIDYFDSEKDCQEIIDTVGIDDLKKYYFLIED